MTRAAQPAGNFHQEVTLLSYLAWQREGCPPGEQDRIWREVEAQWLATRALLGAELSSSRTRARTRTGSSSTRHHSARPVLRTGVSTVST